MNLQSVMIPPLVLGISDNKMSLRDAFIYE